MIKVSEEVNVSTNSAWLHLDFKGQIDKCSQIGKKKKRGTLQREIKHEQRPRDEETLDDFKNCPIVVQSYSTRYR